MASFHSQPLDPARHDLTRLRSGEPELDTWLTEHVAGAEARRVARTFVWCRSDDEVVAAYYSLHRSPSPRCCWPGSPRRNLPRRGSGRGSPRRRPHTRVVAATELVAARFVVVNALHDRAAGFYAPHGFRAIPRTLRLVQKISDVTAALTAS